MEPEPIEQLRTLLNERGRIAVKIDSVESALASIRKDLAAAASQFWTDNTAPDLRIKENALREEQTHERLLRALEDMRAQIEDRVRPLAEQVVRAEVERLRDLSERHQSALKECLTEIDQNILSCRSHMNKYRQRRFDLMVVNQRLAKLGVEPVAIPEEIPTENFDDIIRARVDGLHAEGRI